jgi:glycosyltransferase involved in cell wall biosynthesis
MELLTVFTTTWNEEDIIEDFIQWYRSAVPNCKIVVQDNNSDDNTVDIALKNNCEVVYFDTQGTLDERSLTNLRNNCWKKHPSEYYCVVDSDEWVDVNEHILKRNLEKNEWDVSRCLGFEIFGQDGDEIKDLTLGTFSIGYSKPVLFRNTISEINFDPGSHNANPIKYFGSKVDWLDGYIKLYHTKWRSWERGIARQKMLAPRRSEHSKQMGWAFHYGLPEETHKEYYTEGFKNRVRIR